MFVIRLQRCCYNTVTCVVVIRWRTVDVVRSPYAATFYHVFLTTVTLRYPHPILYPYLHYIHYLPTFPAFYLLLPILLTFYHTTTFTFCWFFTVPLLRSVILHSFTRLFLVACTTRFRWLLRLLPRRARARMTRALYAMFCCVCRTTCVRFVYVWFLLRFSYVFFYLFTFAVRLFDHMLKARHRAHLFHTTYAQLCCAVLTFFRIAFTYHFLFFFVLYCLLLPFTFISFLPFLYLCVVLSLRLCVYSLFYVRSLPCVALPRVLRLRSLLNLSSSSLSLSHISSSLSP